MRLRILRKGQTFLFFFCLVVVVFIVVFGVVKISQQRRSLNSGTQSDFGSERRNERNRRYRIIIL